MLLQFIATVDVVAMVQGWIDQLGPIQADIHHLLPADEDITHEVITTVEAPVSKCFKIWENRMNWLEWFDLLGQVSLRLF